MILENIHNTNINNLVLSQFSSKYIVKLQIFIIESCPHNFKNISLKREKICNKLLSLCNLKITNVLISIFVKSNNIQ